MILAEIDWLSISINLLLILFVVTSLLMSLVILMQRPKQEGLGAAFGSGMTDQVFGARTTSVLQKGTVWLAVMFFVLTLTLAILFAKKNRNLSLVAAANPEVAEDVVVKEVEAPVPPMPMSSLEDELDSTTGDQVELEASPAVVADDDLTPTEISEESLEVELSSPELPSEVETDAPVVPASPSENPAAE